ncbi:MAG: diguanylate cyclase [Candidatus Omnitrophota bacterium]|nr:diguanylate cyclase [Candidatus Omnitrophota bacterium]
MEEHTIEGLLAELDGLRREVGELRAREDEARRGKEAACRLEEANYSAIFNAANDAIFINDIDTKRIIDVNEKACEMFCYPKEEIVNLTINDISSGEFPYTGEEGVKLLEKAANGEPQLFEWFAKDKADRPFWIEINLKRAVIGGKYRLMAVVRDINDRKQTEEKLSRINEVFLNFGPDQLANINTLTALCGELLAADCALYNRLEKGMLCSRGQWNVPQGFNAVDKADGHICHDVIKKGVDEVTVVRNLPETEYARTDPNVALYRLETYVGCPVKFGGEYVGSLCAVYQRDFIPTDEDKRIVSIIASAIGVEEERRKAEGFSHLARFSVERAGDGMFWIGRDARILYANDKACSSLGYSRDELLSMSIPDIDPDFPHERWPSHWRELKERGFFTFETRHRKKDGTVFPVEVTINYMEFEGEEYNFGFCRDITGRRKSEAELLRRDYQLEVLSRTSQHINAILEAPVIMRTMVAAAMELVDAAAGASGLMTRGKIKFTEYNKKGKSHLINLTFEPGEHAPGSAANTLKPYISNDAGIDPRVLPEKKKMFGLRNLICIPILSGKGGLLGCFEIYNKKDGLPFDSQDVFMLQGLAATSAVALENAGMLEERKKEEKARKELNKELERTNRKLNKMALKDMQTGLYNHHYLSEAIEAEFHRARRYGHPLSVIMLDIDYFKSINDVYGHEFGDMVLKQLAAQLKRMVRRYDVVIRFDGEEFVIVSPGVGASAALLMAGRILNAVSVYNFGNDKHAVRLKMSIAVSSYPGSNISKGTDLITAAEKILDKVKESGGNKIYSLPDVAKEKGIIADMREDPEDVKFLKEKIEKLTKRSRQNLVESIIAFAKTIELKDHYTGEHVESTVHFSTEIAKVLDLPREELESIRQASVLHDLGKIGISDRILHKKTKLTKKEFEEIKKHPQIAADIIRPIQFMHDIIPLVLYHHERWDGKGYPAGLKAEEIPIGARIIAVADVYQALTSNRPYRKAFFKKDAIGMLKNGSGTAFDPRIVDIFLEILKKER